MDVVAHAVSCTADIVAGRGEVRPLVAVRKMLHGVSVQPERGRELGHPLRRDTRQVEPEERASS